jgi:hypothetical protein
MAFLSGLPLEKELRGIIEVFKKQRAADIFLRHQGWDGAAPCTLRSAGALFGVTGSATSQIYADLTKSLAGKSPYLPCLDETLAFVRAHLPANACEIELALEKHGLTGGPFRLESLLGAARFFNRPDLFKIVASNGTRLAISQEQAGLIRKITRSAERAMVHHGTTTFKAIAGLAKNGRSTPVTSELVCKVLELRSDFQRLDCENNWFWLSSVRNNPLVKLVRKVLSVSPSVDATLLLTAVSRGLRPLGAALPREVFLEFCRRLPMCCVSGDTVAAAGHIDPSTALCGSELLLLRILKASGPLLKWGACRALCLDAGMNKNTFNSVLRESPIITKRAKGFYSIIGCHVPLKLVEEQPVSAGKGPISCAFAFQKLADRDSNRLYSY